jgi:hypothetical protein
MTLSNYGNRLPTNGRSLSRMLALDSRSNCIPNWLMAGVIAHQGANTGAYEALSLDRQQLSVPISARA